MDGSLPAPASGFRYAMGLMRVHPHLDGMARPLSSADAAPHVQDMQWALAHVHLGDPLALLRAPRLVYTTEYVPRTHTDPPWNENSTWNPTCAWSLLS